MPKRKRLIDRNDPKQNKSLAVRNAIGRAAPDTPASVIVEVVRKDYGHKITPQFVYQLKASDQKKRSKPKKLRKRVFETAHPSFSPENPNGASEFVQFPASDIAHFTMAVKRAKQLIDSAGSYEAAAEILAAFKD